MSHLPLSFRFLLMSWSHVWSFATTGSHEACDHVEDWFSIAILDASTRSGGRAVVGELDASRTAGLDEETHECRNRLLPGPVTLQLAKELRHADHLAARLF